MPVCKCFCGSFLFAEQPEWTQWEHVEEMTIRKTMKVKRVPDEGREGNCIDKEDTLQFIISAIRANAAVTYKVPEQRPMQALKSIDSHPQRDCVSPSLLQLPS